MRLSKKHQTSQKKQVQAPEIVEETPNIKIRSNFKRPDIVEQQRSKRKQLQTPEIVEEIANLIKETAAARA